MRLPQVDADGNETAGIRMPATAVPLATYTGWNLRSAGIGAPDELYSMVGSYIPFARTNAARVKKRAIRGCRWKSATPASRRIWIGCGRRLAIL